MIKRPRKRRVSFDLERLERRDCPAAVVGVSGGGEISEGGESVLLTVVLSEPQRRSVQVSYIVTGDGVGTAVTAADYRLTLGTRGINGRSGAIEFKPGETLKQVRVLAVDDSLREGTESLRFSLFRPRGCIVAPDFAAAAISVTDNDDYTARLAPQGASRIAEGSSAPFVIELSKPATKSETFLVSTGDGSATSSDYRPLRNMPVTILAGQSRSIPFALTTVIDEDAEETDEYFLVSARPRSPGLPAIEPVGVTITGTGPAPLTLSVSDPSVVEGNAGTKSIAFVIELGAPVLAPFTVQYATADGTATAGEDYVAASGSVTFAPGELSKTVTVNVIGDTVVEENETFQLFATASSGGTSVSATGAGTIQDDDTAFEIVVIFPDTSLTAAQQQAFRAAARRWSQIIVGDLPDVMVAGRMIDDLEITATAPLIDGPGGILGQADWRNLRQGQGGLPSTGVMEFDSADVARMVSDGTFTNVILHEMGHVIGIGTLWERFDLVTGVGGDDPQYVGARGLAEYQSLLGSTTAPTGVPVENEGNAGTRDAHWRESVFGTEMMTGIAESPGVPMPISRLTVGSLEDLGYRVNYAAADPFSLRRPGADLTLTSRSARSSAALVLALENQRSRPVLRAAAFARFG